MFREFGTLSVKININPLCLKYQHQVLGLLFCFHGGCTTLTYSGITSRKMVLYLFLLPSQMGRRSHPAH